MRILVFVFALLLPTLGASAQSSTYSTWQNPDVMAAKNEKFQAFLDKLNALIDKAEKARAADPTFLRDLKDLANSAIVSRLNLVFDDTFSDGNFTANPKWQVSAGEFWIEQGWGLRSSVDAAAKAQTQQKNQSGEQAAAALFGQILNQALGGKQDSETSQPQTQTQTAAVIHTNAALSNVFSIAIKMYTRSTEGRIEIAAFQGQFNGPTNSPGYRLVYQAEGRLELQRLSSRGRTVLGGTNKLPRLQDKNFHALTWTRNSDGKMEISIDGTVLLNVTDQGFKDAFSGLAIINGGGDYIFKKIRVDGL